jgi:peptidoglycan/xylan/chitin deacetylase (PgdA/CDA1 family)
MTQDRRRWVWVILAILPLILLALRLFLASAYFDLHPNPAKKVIVVFRNDDIQEFSGSATERRFLQLFVENGIPQTYALVPFKKNLEKENDLVSLLRNQQTKGLAEIALHGYAHENLAGKRRSEFAGKPLEEQLEKIRSGKAYLERIFLREIVTFIPPFNSYDQNTLRAIAKSGIKVLSSSHFFSVPNPHPLQVANLNFLLTDPASYIDLASGHGADLSIFIVYYHSYMEEIYSSDDYFGKATRLIRVIRQHRNIEIDTLGNVALRHADYFKKRVAIDAWSAKTSVLLSFFKQPVLVDRLSKLYHCGEEEVSLFIVMGLLYVSGLLFLGGFVLGFPVAFVCNSLRMSRAWNRRTLIVLTALWFILTIVMIADPRFGIIDMSLGTLSAGLLLHLFIRIPQRQKDRFDHGRI